MLTSLYSISNPLQCEGSESLFWVEGKLSELQVSRTTVNLLAQVEKNIQTKSLVTGAAAVLSGMHGALANSATLVFYDGEDVYNFAAILGDHVICGTFEHGDQFKNGEPVRAVVSRRDGVLYVHAIMQTETKKFYMPVGVAGGDDPFFKHCMNVAGGFSILGSAFLIITGYFSGSFEVKAHITAKDNLLLILAFLCGPALLMFPMEFWTYYSMRASNNAVDIFKVFGFPKPKKIDLRLVGHINFEAHGWKQAWQAWQAWQADKMLAKLGA